MGQIQTTGFVKALPVQERFRPQAQPSEPKVQATSLTSQDQHQQQPTTSNTIPPEGLRFFFVADNHARPEAFEKFRAIANQQDPDLIIEGGDFVHDGTEPEIKRAYAQRQQFDSPFYMVTGNHDAELRGPFSEPPPKIPAFQSFDHKGVHFVLLDNEDQYMSDEVFANLEADLKANQSKPIFVAMHVPPKLSKEPLTVKIGKHIPMNFASPLMKDPAQVQRFHTLMKDYGVKAVLAGHTHFPDEVLADGVRYITSSSSGGLNPTPGIAKDYLDILVTAEDVQVIRRELAPANHVVNYAAEALDFYQDLNRFNHDKLGWNSFYPSANIGYTVGLRTVQTDRGQSVAPTATMGMERIGKQGKGAAFGAVTVSAAQQDLGLNLGLGYKHAVIGDYNKGLYLSGAATANAGYLQGQGTAGVGVKAGVGAQYHQFTLELSQEWATNYKSQNVTLGYRF